MTAAVPAELLAWWLLVSVVVIAGVCAIPHVMTRTDETEQPR